MSGKDQTYEIRYKDGKKFKSSFITAKSPSQAAKRSRISGRILSVNKVPIETMFGIGDKYLKDMFLPTSEMFNLDKLFGKIKQENSDVSKTAKK